MLYILTNISRRRCCLTLGRVESVAWWWASPSWSSPSSSPSSPPASVTAAAAPYSLFRGHFRFIFHKQIQSQKYGRLFGGKIMHYGSRVLLLCCSRWGWWLTLQGGDRQRSQFSFFLKRDGDLDFNIFNSRSWRCVRIPTPLYLATARCYWLIDWFLCYGLWALSPL